MQVGRHERRGDFRRLELRLMKSSKDKHRVKLPGNTDCDFNLRAACRKRFRLPNYKLLIVSLITAALLASGQLEAFCPSKCVCNDQSLSANCSQVSSISIVPMTLNPLLKHMTLNHLPIIELSNSLSVYRQLETLNLKSNQLKQIAYQNFNFKPQHSSITIAVSNQQNLSAGRNFNDPSGAAPANSELNLHNEQLARHLKTTIERHSSGYDSGTSQPDEDEIGFHLRELDLSDNKIDLLGNLNELDLVSEESTSGEWNQPEGGGHLRRLKAAELERQAPFLTLSRLEVLNLSVNRIQRLHRHVFLGLVKLRKLNLSKNYLEYVDKHAFVGLIELELLDLRANRLARQLGQLSLAFCRAPMNELRHLDLSDNQHAPTSGWDQAADYNNPPNQIIPGEDRDSILMLPNQMFICTSNLVSVYLNGLKLRYIQVSAFDNLLHLESLNLSKNYLDQVPTDSFNYFGSNISKSLRQLDLSENLIEFVNVRSFERLENLQKLIMNRMPALVSFDLASLALIPSDDHDQSLDQSSQLINKNLLELQLKHNPRLQSVHSSLSLPETSLTGNVGSGASKIIRFKALRELQLEGNPELRELPLEQMVDLRPNGGTPPIRLDLSYTTKLNCSSCQMGWLIEAARASRSRAPLWTDSLQANIVHNNNNNLMISDPALVGCSWPYAMPLAQLLDLEFNFAAVFDRCWRFRWPTQEQPALADDSSGQLARAEPVGNQSANGLIELQTDTPFGLTLMSLLVVGVTLLIVVKFTLALVAHQRRSAADADKEFQWCSGIQENPASYLSVGGGGGGGGSGSGASNGSPADCSSSSILSAGGRAGEHPLLRFPANHQQENHHQLMIFNGPAGKESAGGFQSKLLTSSSRRGQIELAHGPGNLFSRIANQLSTCRLRPASGDSGPPPASGRNRNQQKEHSGFLSTTGPILEHIAYAGELENSKRTIFANNDSVQSRGYVVNSANINNRLVYANCPQQQMGPLATCPQASYLVKTQQQLTNLSPALYSSGSASTASLRQQQQQQAHIYVTLDGPIKQRQTGEGPGSPECLYERPQAELAGLSFRPEFAKSTNSHQDYKSFEWPPPSAVSSHDCHPNATHLGPLKGPQNNKFKLPDNNNAVGSLRPAFMGRGGGGDEDPSGCEPSDRARANAGELSSSSSASAQLADFGYSRGIHLAAKTTLSRLNRLPSEETRRPGSGHHLFMEKTLNGSKLLPTPEQLATSGSFVATLARPLPATPTAACLSAVVGKYDANHDAVSARTTTDDNDYVINGLQAAAAAGRSKGTAWSDFRVGVPGGDVTNKRAPSPPPPPEAADMIGQQEGPGAMRHTSHLAPDYNDDQQALKQTHNCDIRPAGSIRAGELANSGTLGGISGEPEEIGQSRTNHNEIYSNQFYYCKPQSIATLSRTRLK